jgi:hypothetical protein
MIPPGTRLQATVSFLRHNAAELIAADGCRLHMLGTQASSDGAQLVEEVLHVGQVIEVSVLRFAASDSVHVVSMRGQGGL